MLQRYASYLVESVPKAKAVQTHFVTDNPNRTLKGDLLYYINGILFSHGIPFYVVYFFTSRARILFSLCHWYLLVVCNIGRSQEDAEPS